jgi:aminoglycoside phosphotransferase family enzyme/predicted kinase
MVTPMEQFVTGMLNPEIYPYPCSEVRLVETHISWVFLTGLRALKVKKPVNLGFLDFTSLAQRRRSCHEELRLNRRLAPDMYLDVVPITGTLDAPAIGGTGPILDYAVCMVQFDQACLLSHLSPGTLTCGQIDQLADTCAQFHENAAAAVDSCFGTHDRIRAAVQDNFDILQQADRCISADVARLRFAASLQMKELIPIFDKRRRNNRVRECHGDLHLGNMFLQDDRITVFDGIEFNDDFRWIDVINDIAFLIMDLDDRGHHGFANRFLNRWLEQTGDYDGLAVLRFYCGYRAAVRAKVDVIRMHQEHVSYFDQRHLTNDCRGYLDLAIGYMAPLKPRLTITTGPSGSGKSTVAQRVVDAGDTIRLRSDVERKRMFGLRPEEKSDVVLKQRMYSAEADRATYLRLAELAETVVLSGFPVIVDAAFLRQTDRERFAELARHLGVPFEILKCSASEQHLRDRIEARQRRGTDASEADQRVLAKQLESVDNLSPEEERVALNADEVVDGRRP